MSNEKNTNKMKSLITEIAEKIAYNECALHYATDLHIQYVTENIKELEEIFSNNPDMEIEVDKYLDFEEAQ